MLLNIHSIRNGDIMWENAEKEHCILKVTAAILQHFSQVTNTGIDIQGRLSEDRALFQTI